MIPFHAKPIMDLIRLKSHLRTFATNTSYDKKLIYVTGILTGI